MSLITEALKMTQEAETQPPPAAPSPVTPVVPAPVVVPSARPAARVKIPAVSLVALACILVGINLAHRNWPTRGVKPSPATAQNAPTPPPAKPVTTPEPAIFHHTEPAIEQVAKFAPAAVAAQSKPAHPSEKLANNPPKSGTPAPSGVPPKLLLQGILIDRTSREAMINGSPYKEGDDVDGARVIAIERQRVKLQFNGSEMILRMQ